MERNERLLEQSVINRFETALIDSELIVKIEDKWDTPNLIRRYDIVIYKYDFPLAVVEIKSNLSNKDKFARATDRIRSAIIITNARFGIVTDNELFFIIDKNQIKNGFIKSTFNDILNILIKPSKVRSLKKDIDGIVNIIRESANIHLSIKTNFINFINNSINSYKINFNLENNTFCFAETIEGIQSYENQIFQNLFGIFTETKICHYTSFRTLFEVLNNLTFRLSGIVGMNDKSEVNYVENYLSRGNNSSDLGKPLNKEPAEIITDLNNRYITSCTTFDKLDELTLWRLYSEDAKGVCLVFSINLENLNDHVLLQKVKYADSDGGDKYLDFIKQIKDDVLSLTGFNFEFKKLSYWRHFFKPFEYTVESEVRLLVVDNGAQNNPLSKWIITSQHSIFNPVIDFQLNSPNFPIHLTNIVIGPKCPEQSTNQAQIQEMIRHKNKEIIKKGIKSDILQLKVELSKNTNYR